MKIYSGAKRYYVFKFFVVILIINAKYCNGNIIINKCCKQGEILSPTIKCVRNPIEKNTEYDWFPISSIVNMTTMKIHKTQRGEYLKLLKNATIRIGYWPECPKEERDSTSFTEEKPWFHFLLFSNSDMRFYMRSWKTWHHPSHARNFSLADENVEVDFKEKGWENNEGEIKADQAKLRTLPTDNVCVDGVLGHPNRYGGVLCPCRSVTCIRKCCRDEQYFDAKKEECQLIKNEPRISQKWRPNIFEVPINFLILK